MLGFRLVVALVLLFACFDAKAEDGFTAAITGAYVALADASRVVGASAALDAAVAAVSVGIVDGACVLDLPYGEDASAAVDIAMWDVLGKAAGQPLYRLWGGYVDRVPCYVTCAYYRDGKDLAELRDEMQMLVAQGHRAFKAKVGGLSLAEDIERLEVVREVIGAEADLMVDVNRAWPLATAWTASRHSAA